MEKDGKAGFYHRDTEDTEENFILVYPTMQKE